MWVGGCFLGLLALWERCTGCLCRKLFLDVLVISVKGSRLELVIIAYERNFCDVFQGATFRVQCCVAPDRVFYHISVSNLCNQVLHSSLRQQLAEDICIAGFQ